MPFVGRLPQACCGLWMIFCLFGSVLPAWAQEPYDPKKNAGVYISKSKLLTADELTALVGPETKVTVTGSRDQWQSVNLAGADWSMVITASKPEEVGEHMEGFLKYLQSIAGERPDMQAVRLMHHLTRTQHVLGCGATPTMNEACLKILGKIADSQRAVLFHKESVLDPQGKELLGPKNARDKDAKIPTFVSAEARKAKTVALLKEKMFEPADELPASISEEEVQLQPAGEVVKRMLDLYAVAGCADNIPVADMTNWLKSNELWTSLSPMEQKFFTDPNVFKQARDDMSWRYEGVWILLWVLGKIDDPKFPEDECDAHAVVDQLIKSDAKQWIASAKLRPTAEILDHYDLIYRCRALAFEAFQAKKPLMGVNPDVVGERYLILTWLVNHLNMDWDELAEEQTATAQ